jgi:phosphonate transport system substrate-binding protein
MKDYLKQLLIFTPLVFMIFSGCSRQDAPKKVSLYKRAPVSRDTRDKAQEHALQFGFDLRIGPIEDARMYTSLLNYLEKATGLHFRIKFTERYEDTVENLGTGVTQLASIGPLGFIIGREKYGQGIEYLVSGVNINGDAQYHTIMFTRPGSLIQGIEDLRNRSFAFGSKISTQGHLIPRKMLEDAGIRLEDLRDYAFTGSPMNTVRAVLNGEYDAGGIQDSLARRLADEGKIKIVKISRPYPGSIIAYNSSVDKKIIEAIRSALLAFEPSEKHKDMLVNWDISEMSLGFITVSKPEFYKVALIARKFGLLTK